jgi:hypothetical protein
MTDATQLRAGDLVLAFLRRREPGVDRDARHGILLHAECRDVEAVQHARRAQPHANGLVDHQVQLPVHDIVGGGRILGIQTHRVLAMIDELRLDTTEHVVGTGIA